MRHENTQGSNKGPMWLDQGSKARRPGISVLTHRPGLTPPGMSREGLGVEPTLRTFARAPRPADPAVIASHLPRVDDLSLAEAAKVEDAYWQAAVDAVRALAELVDRGHVYPLGSNRPRWIADALDEAFAAYGLDLFGTHQETPERVPLTDSEREAVFARDGRRCRWCASTDGLAIDHIHPVRWGGTNDPSNLQVLCGSCNSWKSDRVEVVD